MPGQSVISKPAADSAPPAAAPAPAEEPVFALHRGGKLAVAATVPLRDRADLSLAYTPGVAEVCTAIAEQPALAHDYTWKSHTVAVVTDGTAVLGLGDIGPLAALPVMEGKAILFKQFGGIDAVPVCLDCTDVDDVVETVVRLAPAFGGINLEDISAPRCFEIERRLRERLDIPVFHDDQHGTAIVVLAALTNALRCVEKQLADVQIVVAGAGAAGTAIVTLLLAAGAGEVVVWDKEGCLSRDDTSLSPAKAELARATNPRRVTGGLAEALDGADVFIGVSGPGVLQPEWIAKMAAGNVVFALA
ncbi:MAG TPA: malic enzyme-like NAD(P)-binding protein, partial [Actinocrinis sp.]|nr:malic enzyme-like NAD(P)-binding protein [Actinocrinis sp.]